MRMNMLGVSAGLGALLLGCAFSTPAAPCTGYTVGNVFTAVGSSSVDQFTPTGTLVCTLNDTSGSTFTTGMAFDPSANLYVTNFSTGTISQFNSSASLVSSSWGSNTGFQGAPESIAYNATTNSFFVGGPTNNVITEYSTSGSVVHTFTGLIGGATGGTDWVDFQNANTILYIGEGTQIDSLNISTNANASFATIPTYSYALRVIPSGADAGDILIAGTSVAYLMSSTGTILKTYSLPGITGSDFSLNLDPNGTDFWTADTNGNVWEINIATGAIDEEWNDGAGLSTTFGVAVFGETTTVNGGGGGGSATPEPASLALLGSGLIGLAAKLRKMRKA